MKKPNYNAAKRARELKQKAKREAKLAKRQGRVTSPESQPDAGAAPAAPAAGQPETAPSPAQHSEPARALTE
ncbi:MAG TPA: hypothetical protein VGX75_11065, partial [bacterium]|nr:hypothetical protein [bacterium]